MAEHSTIIENNEKFVQATYNGISIYVRSKDGFINATRLCNDGNRDYRTFKKGKRWNEIINYYMKCEFIKEEQNCAPYYELRKGYNKMQGQYIKPDLIHFVAEWISVEYSFKVKHIMNSINNKLHDVLNEKHIDDVVENSKPIFNKITKSIAPSINTAFEDNYCYGVRDRVDRLDSYEREDLKRVINEYNSIKEQLKDVEKKVDEWGAFVKIYHPEFEK